MHVNRFASFVCVAALLLCAGVARAAAINYGNFIAPPGISFNAVTESSPTDAVPLFGPPAPFTTGLDFDPASFAASSTGGGGDITDGQLNFSAVGIVSPSQVIAIDDISVFESGDFSLLGIGTAGTQVTAGVSLRVTVTAIDGVAVAPIALIPVNASVGFNLVANPGSVQPWSLGVLANVSAQLTALGHPYAYGATAVEVVIDDNLVALSQSTSAAFIAKKEFQVHVGPEESFVPEPGAASVLALGAVYGFARRRPR
jgi:hypothetical protein